jgi:3'-phosphoadenosine 5'-phosphosulfate sulfotransferase (PAPS reductase)/FAD synthetase
MRAMLDHMQFRPFQADLANWMLFTQLNTMKNERGKKQRTYTASALQAGLWEQAPGRQQALMNTQPVPRGSELTQASLFETDRTAQSVYGDIPTIGEYRTRFPWYIPERQRQQNVLHQAQEIIEAAMYDYDPSHVFILFSGGNDSLATTLVATEVMRRQHRIPWYVVHINTGIGAERTRQYVRMLSREFFAWPFLEYKTEESYGRICTENGFPGAAAHKYMYTLLKERPLRQLMRDYTPQEKPPDTRRQRRREFIEFYKWLYRGDRAVLDNFLAAYRGNPLPRKDRFPPKHLYITGARREESLRRMGHVEAVQVEDRRVWVAPLTEWTKGDVLSFLAPQSIPRNPVPDILHYSGECFCGGFAEKGELAILEVFFPDEYAQIMAIAKEAAKNGFTWQWDEEPPESFFASRQGQMALEGFEGHAHLCTSCDYRMSANRRTTHDTAQERQVRTR